MVGLILVVSGLVAIGYGCWRGYAAARSALMPLVREGDPTRSLIDATRPIHARVRVRVMARNVLASVGWISIAMYGLLLAIEGVRALA